MNEPVGAGLGIGASLLISAPVIEEIMKAIGIWHAVRRKELDGVMDGGIYVGGPRSASPLLKASCISASPNKRGNCCWSECCAVC